MTRTSLHPRILSFPADLPPADGMLEAVTLENHGGRMNLLLDYHAFKPLAAAELFEREGRAWERVCGRYLPRRVKFKDVHVLQGAGMGASLAGLPRDHEDRRLYAALAWRTVGGECHYLVELRRKWEDVLIFTTKKALAMGCDGEEWDAKVERDWSPTPLAEPRLIPMPKKLWGRFGGNPVSINLDGRTEKRRLFVGGQDILGKTRPQVGAVLNLADTPDPWEEDGADYASDRREQVGEGPQGMDAKMLARLAEWVIGKLRQGKSVLVHCTAGMNRSASVCCGVLILLEGLSAEAALARVREGHPWAKPDPFHWLALRMLAEMQRKGINSSL